MSNTLLEQVVARENDNHSFGGTLGFSNIVRRDGTIVAHRVANSQVIAQRAWLRDMLACQLDIVEVETYGVHDENVMDTPHTPLPISEHYLQNPEDMARNRVYAPISRPMILPGMRRRPTKKVGKEVVYKSKELRYSGVRDSEDWHIISIRDMDTVFRGSRTMAEDNLRKRIRRRGENIHDYVVKHRTEVDAYIENVMTDGWMAYVNGKRVAFGLQKDVQNFLEKEIAAGRINRSHITVRHSTAQ